MMRKVYLAAVVFAVTAFSVYAQRPASASFIIPMGGINDGREIPDPNVSLRLVEQPSQSPTQLQRAKDSLSSVYRNRNHQNSETSSLSAPVLGSNFAGNAFNNGTPTDNEVAVGNDGKLISVQNSNVFRYNTATMTSMGVQSLGVFFNTLGVNASKYDPKVIYDPEANRYILVCLAGYLSNNTHILVGFSRSDSVNGLWNLYDVPGNPFGDTVWSDYPMIAVNQNELFITINHLRDNQPWQTGFVETVVWQLNKWDGYEGDSLRTELHTGINFGGRPVRNLCPVEGGGNSYQSNGMYFLSDRNLAVNNDTVFLVHIADTANSPSQQVTVVPLIGNQSYWTPIPADQPGSGGFLQTNDARILGAYIENNIIQFVCTTLDTATGNTAVYHGVIQSPASAASYTAFIHADSVLDYGYPNIAWTGYGAGDNSCMIVFLHSGPTTNPGYSVMNSDETGAVSVRTAVKNGLNGVSLINGDERWGDYSGIQRKYNELGTCWVNGYYGLTNGTHATWVGEVGRSSDVSTNEAVFTTDSEMFPNPSSGQISVAFTLGEADHVRFTVYDMQGKQVMILLEDNLRPGRHILSFNTAPLNAGVYLLRAEKADGSVLFTERLISQ